MSLIIIFSQVRFLGYAVSVEFHITVLQRAEARGPIDKSAHREREQRWKKFAARGGSESGGGAATEKRKRRLRK